MTFSPTPEILEDFRRGRPIVLVDDEDRENEGDLVVAAEFVTPDLVNFMLREARGELCVALHPDICDRLQLGLQAHDGRNRFGTAFTVTVDAASGVTTGVSAADRAATIRRLADPLATSADFVRPGHIHPLRARRGGVLVRPGQTEGSVDLALLAGTMPAAVIIEILREDGTMARLPDLEAFCARHRIPLTSVADLIEHRRRNERLVTRVGSCRYPTRYGLFDLHLYASPYDTDEHVALVRGISVPSDGSPAPPIEEPIPGRVHSECLTGDALGSHRCDCGDQKELALRRLGAEPRGFFLYMRQEGRGIGLRNKVAAYGLQDQGLDTVEANRRLGFKADLRNYGTGAQILYDLGIRRLRLMTNNPTKRTALSGYGLEIVERIPLVTPPNEDNAKYLLTKKNKMGHLL